MPRISVCIPVYNGARYIGKTIQSILDQAYDDFEIVISDNASTDNTAEVVKSFTDPRIVLRRNETNLGMYPNFNKCIEAASGDYIKFLLSDDIFTTPRALETYVRVLDAHPEVGVVSSNYISMNSQGELSGANCGSDFERHTDRFIRNHLVPTDGRALISNDTVFKDASGRRIEIETCPLADQRFDGRRVLNIIYRSVTDRWVLTPTHAAFRRSMTQEIGLFNEDVDGGWGTETEYWTRILYHSDLYRVGYPLVAFRLHENSGTEAVFKKASQYRDLKFYYDMMLREHGDRLTRVSRVLGPISFHYNIINHFLRNMAKGNVGYWQHMRWAAREDLGRFLVGLVTFPCLSLLKRYGHDGF